MTQTTTIIRSATPGDGEIIAHVHVDAWQSAYREIMPAEFLDGLCKADRQEKWIAILTKEAPKEFNIVAEHDGHVVGFASGGPERKNDPDFTGELYAIYLLDEFRGQGVGADLLRKSIESIVGLGMDSMKVWVLRENPYRAFYERNGGKLLSEEDTIKIGEMEMIEVAYGWTKLTATE